MASFRWLLLDAVSLLMLRSSIGKKWMLQVTLAVITASMTNAQTTTITQPYSATPGCGSYLSGDGNITTPYYPAAYPNSAYCAWTLSASPGKVLQLFCRSFDLENNYDYLYVTSQVPNKTSMYSYSLTGISANCSWILGQTASVTFTSDQSVQRQGFVLGFRSIISPAVNRTPFTACGGKLNGSGIITSPNYPDRYPSNAYCVWSITAQGGNFLRFSANAYDVENAYDVIKIYNSPQVNETAIVFGNGSWMWWWWWSGGFQTGPTAVVVFSSDSSFEQTGFSINFWSEWNYGSTSIAPPVTLYPLGNSTSGYIMSTSYYSGCGGNLNGEGNITTPGYPNNIPQYSSCSWTITAANGSVIMLDFLDFALDKQYSYLNIYDNLNYDNYYLSGSDSNMTSLRLSRQVTLYFSSYSYGSSRGFSIRFKSVAAPNTTNTSLSYLSNRFTSCGSNLTNQGNFTSPNYPAPYPNNAICTWNISASHGKVLQIFCLSFDLENNYDSIYVISQTYNKTTVKHHWLSGNSSNCSWDLGTTATITFYSDATVRGKGFAFGYRSVPPPTVSNRTTFTQCGGNFTGSGSIYSPNYPGVYPSNSRCIWRLRAFDGQVLRLYFNSYDVEETYDTVLIHNSANLSQGAAINYTSYWQQNMYWTQFDSEVIVVFASDESDERQGFQLYFTSEYRLFSGYSTTSTTAPTVGCGGNLNGEGNITTPGYPNNFPLYSSCSWTITAANGSVILLDFLDFALDKQYNYLSIYDNLYYDNYYLSGSDSNMTSLRLSSRVTLYFNSYSYSSSRGFSLRFKSVAASNTTNTSLSYLSNRFTSCGSNLTNQGNLTSPNYPAPYPNNAICTWNISASPGKVLQIFCLSFDLENNYDDVYVTSQLYNKTTVKYNWLSGNSSNCSLDLGTTATVTFYSDATVRGKGFAFGYRSVPPPTVSNRTTFTQCGGNLTGSDFVSSPNYPGVYPSNSKCIWRLRAFEGQVLRLYFYNYNVEDSYDTVLIYNSANLSQGAAMNYTSFWQQNMYSTQFNSEVIVVFTSDGSEERQGFQIYFFSEYPFFSGYSTTSTIFPNVACGSNLTGDGNITSPYYPNLYPNKAYCAWNLYASPGKVLQLTCKLFDLENNYDYLYVTSKVSNKTSSYFDRFTGISSNCSWILGPTASLTFTSDSSVQRQGFVLIFRSIIPATVNRTAFTECGGNLTGSGTVSSPNYPAAYPSNSRCIWRLRASDGQVLRLYFNAYDVENEYDFAVIYNSKNISQSAPINYTSFSQQGMYFTQFNPEVIVVFSSDQSVERPGFQLYFYSEYQSWGYSTTTAPLLACGGYLYGEGTIATPGYPNNFPAYSLCSWTITASNGSAILLEFLDFALDKQSSYLYIWNIGSNFDYYYLSGTDSNITSLRLPSQVSLYFGSYNYGTSRGFNLAFKSVAAPNASNLSSSYNSNVFRSCGFNLTNQGNFTSPNYPAPYPNNANCVWNITASPGKVLQLFCISFDIENFYDSVFVTSQVYNKTTSAYYWLNGNATNGNCSVNLGASAMVVFSSDATVRRQGFVIGFRSVVPPSIVNRTTFTQCGGNLTGSGSFSSPNYPGTYPSNSRCIWRLRASDGQVLRLYFNSYDVEDSYDSVIIYNSRNISQSSAMNYTSYWQHGMYWTQFNSEIIVAFTSDESIERSGFEIAFYSEYQSWSYSTTTTAPSVGCGGDINREGNVTSPNYPNQYPVASWCSWYVYTSYGSSLVIKFVDLDIVKGSDYITIYTDGSSASYGGSDLPRAIRGGSSAYIQFSSAFLRNNTLPRRGFKIQIYSTNSTTNSSNLNYTESINEYFTSCGGNFTGKGNLTSPGYPALYPNKAYCSYSLTAQSANDNIVLKFSTFDLEQSYDYLYVYGWSSYNNNFFFFPSWFTGSSLPSTLVLPSQATIYFSSDTTVRGRGFFATFISVPANSSSTLVTVPGYTTAIFSTNRTSVPTTSSLRTTAKISTTKPTTKLTTIVTTKLTTKLSSPTVPTSLNCGRVLYNGAEFSSPNYPAGYPNNTICNWTLIASPGKVVLLSFQVFALESGADYLRIYNGTEVSWKTSFVSYTGFSVPLQLLLTGSVTVVFTSDESLSFQGFKANFTSVPPRGGSNVTSLSTSIPFVCGGSLGVSGEIVSPNFPYAYPNEVSCTWIFTVPRGGGYRFEFLNFSTEQFWDNVVIRSGAVEITRVSGSQIPAAVVIVSNGSISFTSDESVQMTGFRIRYSRLASVTTPRTTAKPTTSSLGMCGQAVTDMRMQNARIVQGTVAPANSTPWQVMIVRASTNFSGVLLNKQWVLTAASNLKVTLSTVYSLLLGKQRANAQEVGQLKVAASQILRYPGYNAITGEGDLALIKLATPVTFTTKIRPICLPTATVKAGDVCLATGWGATNGSSQSSTFLRVAQVTIINTQSCFNYIQTFTKNQICGGYIGGGQNVCQGDTGGPLVYFRNGRYELQGITSSLTSCGKPFSPSAFTAVAPYISWINSVAI